MNILQAIQNVVKFTSKFRELSKTGKIQITFTPDNKGTVKAIDQEGRFYSFEIIDQNVTEKTSDIQGGDRRIIISLELKDRVKG